MNKGIITKQSIKKSYPLSLPLAAAPHHTTTSAQHDTLAGHTTITITTKKKTGARTAGRDARTDGPNHPIISYRIMCSLLITINVPVCITKLEFNIPTNELCLDTTAVTATAAAAAAALFLVQSIMAYRFLAGAAAAATYISRNAARR